MNCNNQVEDGRRSKTCPEVPQCSCLMRQSRIGKARSCPFCAKLSSSLWSIFFFGPRTHSSQSFLSDGTAGFSPHGWIRIVNAVCMHCPLVVNTTVGFLDLRKASNSSELNSFFLIVCIEAPEWEKKREKRKREKKERKKVMRLSFFLK